VPGPLPGLTLVADYSGGVRLSDILAGLDNAGKMLSTGATLFLIKEILDAVAGLHRHKGEISHGVLAPERVVIAAGKVRIADYALGSAIEQLRFSSERYWKELRVAVPVAAGGARFDRRVDVAQIGMIALALFAGRPLRESEHIGALNELLTGLTRGSALAPALRTWLLRALNIDLRRVFVSAGEAAHGLNEAMSEAGLRPSAADLGSLGVRAKRIAIPVSVKTPLPPPVAPPALKPQVKNDSWQARDVNQETMYVPPQEIMFVHQRTEPGVFQRRRGLSTLLQLGVFGALITGVFSAAQFIPAPAWLFSRSGTLVVESNPEGIQLLIDGESQGVTPITLKVKSGTHKVELRGAGKPRVFNVFISSGARVSQYIEFPQARNRNSQKFD
jgi:PEGA domain-containing protein